MARECLRSQWLMAPRGSAGEGAPDASAPRAGQASHRATATAPARSSWCAMPARSRSNGRIGAKCRPISSSGPCISPGRVRLGAILMARCACAQSQQSAYRREVSADLLERAVHLTGPRVRLWRDRHGARCVRAAQQSAYRREVSADLPQAGRTSHRATATAPARSSWCAVRARSRSNRRIGAKCRPISRKRAVHLTGPRVRLWRDRHGARCVCAAAGNGASRRAPGIAPRPAMHPPRHARGAYGARGPRAVAASRRPRRPPRANSTTRTSTSPTPNCQNSGLSLAS
jgi:hypothetical protein